MSKVRELTPNRLTYFLRSVNNYIELYNEREYPANALWEVASSHHHDMRYWLKRTGSFGDETSYRYMNATVTLRHSAEGLPRFAGVILASPKDSSIS